MISIETVKQRYDCNIALLLLCCRVHFNTETLEKLQQFIDNNPVDWDEVQYLLAYHRIEPIIYAVLEGAVLPAQTTAQIKQQRLFLISRSFKHALETERIISLLNENNIRCIPYKGIVFSKQFYGDVVSRDSSDIDLVIEPADFEKVMVLMQQLGYSFEHQLEYNYFKDAIFNRKKDLCFNRYNNESREFHVEFHWKINENLSRIKKQANALLYNSDRKEVLIRNSVEMLNNNAHFLAVFIHHSINDAFSIFRNIVDICQLSKNAPSNADISYMENVISQLQLNKAVGICRYLSKELLGVTLPFFRSSGDAVPEKVKKYFTAYLLQKDKIGVLSVKLRIYRKNILYLKPNTPEKIKYIIGCLQMRFVPSAKDIRIFHLPKKLAFLYVILKPFRSLFSRMTYKEDKRMAQQQHQAFLSSHATDKK